MSRFKQSRKRGTGSSTSWRFPSRVKKVRPTGDVQLKYPHLDLSEISNPSPAQEALIQETCRAYDSPLLFNRLAYWQDQFPENARGIALPPREVRYLQSPILRNSIQGFSVGIDEELGTHDFLFPAGLLKITSADVLRNTDHQIPVARVLSPRREGIIAIAKIISLRYSVAEIYSPNESSVDGIF